MEDKIISPMQDFLPGALSRWILGLSIAVSGSLLLLPSYDLPAKYLTDPDIIKLLMRLLSAGTPLLIGLIALIILQVRHNRRTSRELNTAQTDNRSYFHQVSSLNASLTEQNKEHIAKIDMLSAAADSFRDEARQMRTLATEIQKELTSLKDEYKDLKQRNAGTESLALMRGRNLEQCQKELEELRKSPPTPPIGGWT